MLLFFILPKSFASGPQVHWCSASKQWQTQCNRNFYNSFHEVEFNFVLNLPGIILFEDSCFSRERKYFFFSASPWKIFFLATCFVAPLPQVTMALCWEPFTLSKLVISFSLCCCFLIQSFDHLTPLVFWQLSHRFCWGGLCRIYFSTQNTQPQLDLPWQLSYYQLTECKWAFSHDFTFQVLSNPPFFCTDLHVH